MEVGWLEQALETGRMAAAKHFRGPTTFIRTLTMRSTAIILRAKGLPPARVRAMDYSVLKSEIDELRQEIPQSTFLLYAMGLRLGTMDYDGLRVNCLLDGPDDKKIDFFHVDHETGIATVAQGYESVDWTRIQAPANKAADLNTAVNWLLESDLSEIPRDAVRACAEELRDGLSTGEITRAEIYYIHNLPHSAQKAYARASGAINIW